MVSCRVPHDGPARLDAALHEPASADGNLRQQEVPVSLAGGGRNAGTGGGCL